MNKLLTTIASLAAGAAAMYYLDPDQGRRRRALTRDKMVATSHDVGGYARAKGKRAGDQLRGMVARGRARLALTPPSSDAQLLGRVQTQLGRLASHPRVIDVEVNRGRVRLSGHVLARDVDRVLSGIAAIPGVHGVDDRLNVHEEAGGISQLQGEGRVRRSDGAALRPVLPLVALAAPLAILLRGGGRTLRARKDLRA